MKELTYNIFDIDENLLFLNTPLYFKRKVSGKWINVVIYPNDFSKIRKKYGNNYIENDEWKAIPTTFDEFRDTGPRGKNAFLIDFKNAIKKKKFGPSWEKLTNTILEGRLFGIITTRGHEPNILRKAIEYIVYEYFTDEQRTLMKNNIKKIDRFFGVKSKDLISEYLDKCYFIGLFSDAFYKQFKYDPRENLNKGKNDAISFFVEYVRKFAKSSKKHLKVGFSDDDVKFSGAAKELFFDLKKSLEFQESFYVFDTSNPKIKGGIKTKI